MPTHLVKYQVIIIENKVGNQEITQPKGWKLKEIVPLGVAVSTANSGTVRESHGRIAFILEQE